MELSSLAAMTTILKLKLVMRDLWDSGTCGDVHFVCVFKKGVYGNCLLGKSENIDFEAIVAVLIEMLVLIFL